VILSTPTNGMYVILIDIEHEMRE